MKQFPEPFVDQRIVTAGLEEAVPVPERSFEQVLAPRRVGQDAIHVEDDGGSPG